MILKGILLGALIKFLLAMDKPFWCAGIYTTAIFLLGLLGVMAGSYTFVALLIGITMIAVASTVYFFLLSRFAETGLWWIIMLVGFVGLLLL